MGNITNKLRKSIKCFPLYRRYNRKLNHLTKQVKTVSYLNYPSIKNIYSKTMWYLLGLLFLQNTFFGRSGT